MFIISWILYLVRVMKSLSQDKLIEISHVLREMRQVRLVGWYFHSPVERIMTNALVVHEGHVSIERRVIVNMQFSQIKPRQLQN